MRSCVITAAILGLAVLIGGGGAALGAQPPINSHPAVAMTFDDLPLATGASGPLTPADAAEAKEVNRTILQALADRHIPATGFVIQRAVDQLGADASGEILREWVAEGFDLGNHLYSHADVNRLTLAEAEQEIVRGEPAINQALAAVGRKPRYVRFPYNHTGDTKEKHDGIAAFMGSRGYRLAPCTIDNEDYEFNRAYRAALTRQDAAAAGKIRAAYLAFTAAEIDWYSKLDREVFGRQPPHVMLLHVSPLNRDTIEQVLTLFAERGYRFVKLGEALKDPAYAVPETFVTKYGPMWGYRWAKELNVRVHGEDEPEPPAWISQYGRPAPTG